MHSRVFLLSKDSTDGISEDEVYNYISTKADYVSDSHDFADDIEWLVGDQHKTKPDDIGYKLVDDDVELIYEWMKKSINNFIDTRNKATENILKAIESGDEVSYSDSYYAFGDSSITGFIFLICENEYIDGEVDVATIVANDMLRKYYISKSFDYHS